MRISLAEQFKNDLERIGNELSRLEAEHRLWWSLVRRCHLDPRLGKPGLYMHTLQRWHYDSLAVGIRRQIDDNADSISLVNCIKLIASRKLVIRRSDFMGRYSEEMQEIAIVEWNSLTHQDCAEIYPPSRAYRHYEWLRKISDEVRRWINKTVAHSARSTTQAVTLNHVWRLLQIMERLVEHYQFVTQSSYCRLRAQVWLDQGWQKPLCVPWFEPSYTPDTSSPSIDELRSWQKAGLT